MSIDLVKEDSKYDVAITGGGLAGLAQAILLARAGYRIILFEKEKFPFHRVCGEYISLESWDFLVRLGVDLPSLQLPIIKKLEVTTINGKCMKQPLPLGGFGISRYLLDSILADIAKQAGVTLMENTRVDSIEFNGAEFIISTPGKIFNASIACGSYGKRSNLDIKWKRPFTIASKNKLNNYIGVKYHVRGNFPGDTIALHTFQNGYCGIGKIENDKYNLCYLTTASNLKKSNGSILQMEESILYKNPFLKEIFSSAEKCPGEPVTISQISFDKKTSVENHVLMAGDAAGMITPLCGNGMSMALYGAKLAVENIDLFLRGKISRKRMEEQYARQWQSQFSRRLLMGRRIQRLSGNPLLMNLFISAGNSFTPFTQWLIGQTHGKPF